MEKTLENKTTHKKNRSQKTIIWIFASIILILAILLIYKTNKVNTIIVEKDQTTFEKQALQLELDTLLTQHERIKIENASLADSLYSQDSIIQAKADEIKQLIARQADFWRTKKKLKLLRNITQDYVRRIDSLYTVNQELRDENLKIKNDYTTEKRLTTKLSQEKDDLTEKVTKASTLKAYNISALGIRFKSGGKKEVVTDKARRVEKIKICFTLSENLIIPAGKKNIFIRIARPDRQIITGGSGDVYSFMHNNKKILFSIKKEIDYKNQSIKFCMYWSKRDKKIPAMTGIYHIAIFDENNELGQAQFELR